LPPMPSSFVTLTKSVQSKVDRQEPTRRNRSQMTPSAAWKQLFNVLLRRYSCCRRYSMANLGQRGRRSAIHVGSRDCVDSVVCVMDSFIVVYQLPTDRLLHAFVQRSWEADESLWKKLTSEETREHNDQGHAET
jgi:hypothetical protein